MNSGEQVQQAAGWTVWISGEDREYGFGSYQYRAT